jgi:hypothetical protein
MHNRHRMKNRSPATHEHTSRNEQTERYCGRQLQRENHKEKISLAKESYKTSGRNSQREKIRTAGEAGVAMGRNMRI